MSVFDENFLWGAATSAPQIEGGYLDDGRTPSLWDEVSPKRIKLGGNCHTACDHYHRMKEDVAIMKSLGLKAYRFSVSWPRVMPSDGKPNPLGIRFYSDLVDELIANGIEPILTLFHWDVPMWMMNMGGWQSEKIIDKFAEYTKVVVEALSDRVKYWIPMNEPQCFATLSYLYGVHAPFKHRIFDFAKISRIAMIAFAESVRTIRKYAHQTPIVGLAMSVGANIPKNESKKEIEKARRRTFNGLLGHIGNKYYCDPLLLGKPATGFGVYHIRQKDADRIKCDIDFVGVNIYQPFSLAPLTGDPNSEKRTTMKWIIDGRVLYWALRFFYDRYKLPMFVTENGMANADPSLAGMLNVDKVENGRVRDIKRIAFMQEYLENLKRAVSEGIPTLGYLHWSLLDNFEWCEGYTQRFGLVHVDFATGERTVKDSALYYKDIIASNGETI